MNAGRSELDAALWHADCFIVTVEVIDMATRVKLTDLERRIIDRVYGAAGGFERVEDLHDAMGVDRHDFVEALESLEGDGFVAISNFSGTIIVTSDDPLSLGERGEALGFSTQVGQC